MGGAPPDVGRGSMGKAIQTGSQQVETSSAPLTETLDPEFVERVITTLFPTEDREQEEEEHETSGPLSSQDQEWTEDCEIGAEELQKAIKRGLGGNTAPGPDGLHKKVWALAMEVMAERVRRLFNACLKKGIFPPAWRRATLVLLHKEGKDDKEPSAYRPICLLDEAGKLFERVVVNRLVQHLTRVGPDISDAQYGFRAGLSTVDAIQRVRTLTEERTAQGGVSLAISLDITNAFNSLPWYQIKESLRWHGVPQYLANVIRDYLRDRWVVYSDRTGTTRKGKLHRGVPLGPLLWDLGYNVVLQTALPPGCSITCSADDTLILAGGRD